MTKTTEDKRLKEVKKVIEEWDTYPKETQIALESAISMARILTMIRDNEKAGQGGEKLDLSTKNLGQYIKEKGYNLSELSKKTEVSYMALYNSLMNENTDRALRADEYLSLCKHLEVDPMVFYPDEQKEAG